MFLPILAFATLLVLLVNEVLFPEEEKKTPEQELKDAIMKYVSKALKDAKDQD